MPRAFSSRITSRTSRRPSGSSPEVGSSRNTSSGSPSSACASPMRCCMPLLYSRRQRSPGARAAAAARAAPRSARSSARPRRPSSRPWKRSSSRPLQPLVEGEVLGQVADARAGAGSPERRAEQPARARGGAHQPEQHLHGGRLARAVRPEEAEDLAARRPTASGRARRSSRRTPCAARRPRARARSPFSGSTAPSRAASTPSPGPLQREDLVARGPQQHRALPGAPQRCRRRGRGRAGRSRAGPRSPATSTSRKSRPAPARARAASCASRSSREKLGASSALMPATRSAQPAERREVEALGQHDLGRSPTAPGRSRPRARRGARLDRPRVAQHQVRRQLDVERGAVPERRDLDLVGARRRAPGCFELRGVDLHAEVARPGDRRRPRARSGPAAPRAARARCRRRARPASARRRRPAASRGGTTTSHLVGDQRLEVEPALRQPLPAARDRPAPPRSASRGTGRGTARRRRAPARA